MIKETEDRLAEIERGRARMARSTRKLHTSSKGIDGISS
jgi:hypothetical protein